MRLPCPAGTLILFDATLPHGTKPNNITSADMGKAPRSRAILFLRYITSDSLPPVALRERAAALRRIAKEVGFVPDEDQAKLLYGVCAGSATADGGSKEGQQSRASGSRTGQGRRSRASSETGGAGRVIGGCQRGQQQPKDGKRGRRRGAGRAGPVAEAGGGAAG